MTVDSATVYSATVYCVDGNKRVMLLYMSDVFTQRRDENTNIRPARCLAATYFTTIYRSA